MASFSIDDVRETLTTDLTRFLARIDATAEELVEATRPPRPDATFRVLEDAGHAIYGTTALVGATSLSGSARLLETLAQRGEEEFTKALEHAARAHEIAALIRAGGKEMSEMLEHELDRRSDDAQWIAMDWQQRADALLAIPESARLQTVRPPSKRPEAPEIELESEDLEPAEEGESFTFHGQPEVEDELREVFQEEAREQLVALQGHLDALLADTQDLPAARHVERIFHTLKGAAATVGLVTVSAAAHSLQDRMQGVVERGEVITTDLLRTIVSDTRSLLASAGLPDVSLALRGDGSRLPVRSAPAEVRRDFVQETKSIHAEVSGMLGALDDEDTRQTIARLFHRLKGSALVVGENAIAAEAQRLQLDVEGGTNRANVAQGLARLAIEAGIQLDSSTDLSETNAAFQTEAREICEEASAAIADLEGSGSVDRSVEHLAKLFHRLRGSALVASESTIAKIAEELEATCEGSASVTVEGLKNGVDRIRAALGISRGDERVEVPSHDPELWEAFSQECAELLDAVEQRALALEGLSDPRASLQALMPVTHTLKGVVNTMGLGPTGRALHRVEDLLDWLAEANPLPSIRDVASFLLHVVVEVRRNLRQAKKGFVELSLSTIEAKIQAIRGGMREPSRSRDEASSEASTRDRSSGRERAFVRVAIDRLDGLMNLAGELVVSRSRLLSRIGTLEAMHQELGRGSRRLIETVEKFCEEHEFARLDGALPSPQVFAAAVGEEGFHAAAGPANDGFQDFGELELDRYEDIHILSRSLAELTNDLGEIHGQLSGGLSYLADDADAFGGLVSGIQSEVTRARMVPLEVLFTRLRLPVRDAAMRENKDVRVSTRGDDVHLDKTIADALFQPMLHLVRNAVAHGLRSRAAGNIELTARQELGQIILEVRDDGDGLDLERLREQGVAMGLLSADTPLGDPSVRDLVFVAGLSTETSARAVAGRGVGCDVVKRAIERLNGSIRVESERGKGTTFILRLPLTLAITKALLVSHGTQSFALPLYFAERILDAEEQQIVESAGQRRVLVDSVWSPVQRLSTLLGLESSGEEHGPILVVRASDEQLMVQVDAVVGQEEIVVKSLGAILSGHPHFAGVTIRGTGQMVLILDVPSLLDSRGEKRREAKSPAQQISEPVKPISVEPVVHNTPKAPAQRRLRILFVDDSLSVRKVAEKSLASLGVDVTTAIDGIDALAKLRESTFDLVFTDLEMPRMHGFELIREIRFVKQYQDLPIVVVTSRSGQKHQEQAKSLGASEYLTKPFNAQGLAGAIERWGRIRANKEVSS